MKLDIIISLFLLFSLIGLAYVNMYQTDTNYGKIVALDIKYYLIQLKEYPKNTEYILDLSKYFDRYPIKSITVDKNQIVVETKMAKTIEPIGFSVQGKQFFGGQIKIIKKGSRMMIHEGTD